MIKALMNYRTNRRARKAQYQTAVMLQSQEYPNESVEYVYNLIKEGAV